MFNHETLDWDPEVLGLAGIGRAQLSPLVSVNTGMTGLCRELGARWESLAQIPWYPALGDGAVANLGSGCVDETQVAVTVGTSGAMRVVMPAAEGLQKLPPGLWMYRVDEADGLVGGSLNNGGNVLSYLSQVLQVPASAMRERELAALQPDAHGLTILPFFAGERSPGYRGEARAAITGLSFSTTPTELWRAALEAIAYRFAAIYDRLRLAIPKPRQIVASGAALLHSPVWVQLIADTLGVPVTASGEDEASARGAALLALRALHIVSSLSALPGALGETCFPDPVHFEIYRRARERQELLYHLLLDNAVKI
jgi:gluconokinase